MVIRAVLDWFQIILEYLLDFLGKLSSNQGPRKPDYKSRTCDVLSPLNPQCSSGTTGVILERCMILVSAVLKSAV